MKPLMIVLTVAAMLAPISNARAQAKHVSTRDLDSAQPGIQNVWIQALGCDDANTTLR